MLSKWIGRTFSTELKQLRLTLACPHATIFKDSIVDQVNISTTDGDQGILANHVPTILQLRPGLFQVISNNKTTDYFVSGGFATVNPDSSIQVAAMEAVPLDQLDHEMVKKNSAELSKASSSKPEDVIENEVYQALNNVLSKVNKN